MVIPRHHSKNHKNIGRSSTISLTVMLLAGFSSSRRDVSKAFVRAAFTSSSFGSGGIHSVAKGRPSIGYSVVSIGARDVSPSVFNANTSTRTFNDDWMLHARRTMSTTAEDQELDHALDEILGEALAEAENPAVGEDGVSSRGHIKGSHPFPRDLVEQVSSHASLFGPIPFPHS